MVIGIIGESCTGKSTLAEKLKFMLNAQVYTGKDYLRLAKNEAIAKHMFEKMLTDAMDNTHILYVISEKEHLPLLPEKAYRVLVTADLELIKERFSKRMHGHLPAPVALMLENKHGCFDNEKCDVRIVSGQDDLDQACECICSAVNSL